MFKFSQKADIKQLTDSASEYVFRTRIEQRKKAREESSQSDGVKYSLRGGDDYDIERIQSNIQKYRNGNLSALDLIGKIDETANESFVNKLLEHIRLKQVRDSKIYKAANIDRRLFSKIVSDYTYKPAKDTCIALALALNLSLEQANDLLERAGYTLSHSNHRDLIIEYFFKEGFYKLDDINEVLINLNQKPLGRL